MAGFLVIQSNDDKRSMTKIYLDTSDGMAAYVERYGALYEKTTGRWYVEGEVPNELVGLLPKMPNRAAYKTTPFCPTCGGVMVQRFRKADKSPFWGCKNFPKCHGTLNYQNYIDGVDSDNGKRCSVGEAAAKAVMDNLDDTGHSDDPPPATPKTLSVDLTAEKKRIYLLAVEIRGNLDRAKTWLSTPKHGLGGQIPVDIMTTVAGCQRVAELLEKTRD